MGTVSYSTYRSPDVDELLLKVLDDSIFGAKLLLEEVVELD